MISKTALSLLIMAAAAPAFAQGADDQPTSQNRVEDTPTATAQRLAVPPIDELSDPRKKPDEPPPPREQVFISPSGEPFRAPHGQPYPVNAWFARADADHDGALSPAEFTADQIAFFDTLDANKDGVIDGFESGAYETTVAPEVAAEPRRGHDRRRGWLLGMGRAKSDGPRLQGAAFYGLINEPLPVRAADINLDFKVSRQEALTAATRRFGLLDTNKDGRITLAELPLTLAQTLAAKRKD